MLFELLDFLVAYYFCDDGSSGDSGVLIFGSVGALELDGWLGG